MFKRLPLWQYIAIVFVLLVLVIIISTSGESEDSTSSSDPTTNGTSQAVASDTSTPGVDSAGGTESADAIPYPTSSSEDSTLVDSATSSPTLDTVLSDLLFCERLRLELSMVWGQSPAVIHSADPRVSGQLEAGDYIRLLSTNPDDTGALRIQVFPHDNRAVGQTENRVWIDVNSFARFNIHELAFTCEDA